MQITGKEILALGYRQGKQIRFALEATSTFEEEKEALKQLKVVLNQPQAFTEDKVFSTLAHELIKPSDQKTYIPLKEKALDYEVYGKENIEAGALRQINRAMRLPVAKAGALMPDAHQGYGLPIGGVLATENAVIPYAVGVDIGCRMCMTIYELPVSTLKERKEDLKNMLLQNTRFGKASFKNPVDHEVLEHSLYSMKFH